MAPFIDCIIFYESAVCHRGYAYIVLQTVQRPGVCSAVYDAVNYREPLKSFDMSRVYIPDGTAIIVMIDKT